MLIDWFTVVAQLINFLILVFLLHRFLYQPIVKTIQARQEQIDRHWQEAKAEQEKAEIQIALYQAKQQQLEQQQQQIMAQAKQEGEQEYQKLVKQARQEVVAQQATWEKAIAQQQDQFFENLEDKLSKQVYEVAYRAFQDLADVSLEQQVIKTFIRRLQNLPEEERQSLVKYLQRSNNALIIRSSFDLSPENCEQILECLHQQKIYQGKQIQFTTAPELICGLELQTSDYKIPWNLKNYLVSLEKNLDSQ